MFAAILMAATAAPPPLVPSGKWKIDYAEQNCVLSRPFATDGGNLTLTLVPNPTATTDLILFLPDNGKRSSSQPTITFPQKRVTLLTTSYVLQDKPLRVVRVEIPSDFILGLSDTLEIRLMNKDISIPIADSAKAFAALKTCQDDLFATWGLDRAKQVYAREFRRDATVARGESGTSRGASWFRSDDFPATRLGHDGRVKALWRIGLDGKSYDCRIIQSGGIADFDKSTCEVILKKANYARIVDAQGKPAIGWDWQSINWQTEG